MLCGNLVPRAFPFPRNEVGCAGMHEPIAFCRVVVAVSALAVVKLCRGIPEVSQNSLSYVYNKDHECIQVKVIFAVVK